MAGCSSGSGGVPTPPVTSIHLHSPHPRAHSHSPSPSPSVTSSSPSPTTSTTTAAAAAQPCTTGQLSLSLGQSQGALGSFYTPIVLTNTSSGACTLFGFPGVSFTNRAGQQVGQSAARSHGAAPRTVTLAGSGGQASALLHEPDPSAFPPSQCHKAMAYRIRVYPPSQFSALSTADHTPVCTGSAGRSDVSSMQAGDNPSQ